MSVIHLTEEHHIPTALSPATVACDALHAAGFITQGIDMQTYDPIRAALAERFASAARSCRGDVARLEAMIRPQLADAVTAVRLQLEAEARELLGG